MLLPHTAVLFCDNRALMAGLTFAAVECLFAGYVIHRSVRSGRQLLEAFCRFIFVFSGVAMLLVIITILV